MRLLIASDAPFQPSSWGQQVKLLGSALQAAGHTVAIYAPSYYGEQLVYDGLLTIGGNADLDGSLMGVYAQRFNADLILSMKNLSAFNANALRTLPVPWCPVAPLETEPPSAADRGQVSFATMPLALSKHAQTALQEYGIRSLYTPLGIDTTFWTPGDADERARTRAAWGIADNTFVAAFVGANQTKPSRKALDQIILAWASFIELRPENREAVLILHTALEPDQGGLDLVGLLHTLNIPSVNLRVTDQLEYRSGSLPADRVRSIYRAADVLLNPSMGGACELALLEGQACGLPPISTDWTAMREHNWSGWQIGTMSPRLGGEPMWDVSGGFFFRPSQRAIVQCLVMANEHCGNATIRRAATAGAQAYDVQRVISDHWLPALEQIERLIKGAALFPVPEKVEAVS